MKHLLFILCLGFGINAQAQSATFDSLCSKLTFEEDAMQVKVPGWILRMGLSMAEMDDEVGMTMTALKKGLRKAHILILENRGISNSLYRRMQNEFRKDGFEEYVSIRDGSDRVHIMLKEKKDCISNMMIMVNDECGEFVAVNLKTKLTYEDLEDLMSTINRSDGVNVNVEVD